MASLTYTVSVQGSQDPVNVTRTPVAAKLTDFAEVVPASTTDFLVNIAIDVSELEFFILLSDQALTLKTNSTGAPDQTIAIAANVPLTFTGAAGETNPLTVDITKFYFTNASATAANVRCVSLQDPTP